MTQPTTPAVKAWFVLQDAEDDQPYAVAALNTDGLPMRFVPGKGLVDWPPLAGALLGFDPDPEVQPTDEAKAKELMAKNVGALPESYVTANQGTQDGNDQADPIEADDNPTMSTGTPPADAPAADAPPADAAPADAAPADLPASSDNGDGTVAVDAAGVKGLLDSLRDA